MNDLGVSEPVVARQGALDQILVQLPGVTDVARAKEIIRSTALLELKQVEQGPVSDKAQLLTNGQVPPDMEVLPGVSTSRTGEPGGVVYYLVRRVPVVSGRDLRNARPTSTRTTGRR